MNEAKRKRLEAKGWQVGTVSEFLGLSQEEEQLVEARLRLTNLVRELRQTAALSQGELAKRFGSSQSRLAKIESGDPSVSLDLIFKAIFAAGASVNDIAAALQAGGRAALAAPKAKARGTGSQGSRRAVPGPRAAARAKHATRS